MMVHHPSTLDASWRNSDASMTNSVGQPGGYSTTGEADGGHGGNGLVSSLSRLFNALVRLFSLVMVSPRS